jgi:16S rRNA (cytidine1402-2'-O)-methyltransferase
MPKLYLVPTPLGNLGDMTHRAVEVLNKVDLILAEDTRKSGILLKHFQVSKPVQSHHKFNEHRMVEGVVQRIAGGQSVAVITDAGTPGISDPGFLLVRTCIQAGIAVETLPGPTAFVPALVNSGLPCDRFVFEGLLPQKKGRNKRISALAREERTIVFYESPHRIAKTLQQLAEQFGKDRKASVSRELTKIHEETVRGTLEELADHFNENPVKGEIVLIISGFSDR